MNKIVFALRAWSVKRVADKFWISPTAHFEDVAQFKGPYKTLRRACTAIARKMEEEVTKRQTRMDESRSFRNGGRHVSPE